MNTLDLTPSVPMPGHGRTAADPGGPVHDGKEAPSNNGQATGTIAPGGPPLPPGAAIKAPGEPYTPEEDAVIRAEVGWLPYARIAVLIGRSADSVRWRANHLGCSRPRRDRAGRQRIMRLPAFRAGDPVRVKRIEGHPLSGRTVEISSVTAVLTGERGAKWILHAEGVCLTPGQVEGWRLCGLGDEEVSGCR